MSARRAVIEGRQGRLRRTVRIVRYPDGWDVTLGIGDADPNRNARASAALDPEQAREVARELLAAADLGEQARREAAK